MRTVTKVFCLIAGTFTSLAVSYAANSYGRFPEIAGRWQIEAMEEVPHYIRHYVWEGLKFDIEEGGFFGNHDTPFTMIVG